MTQQLILKYLFLSIFLVNTSCVVPLNEKFNGSQIIFIVDGHITNDPSENYITLRESIPWTEGYTQYKGITEAEVFVTINQSEKITLTEYRDGHYQFPQGFNGQIGSTYQLSFITSDGFFFESSEETMVSSPKIDSVYHTFEAEAIKDSEGNTIPGFHFFINLKDDPETNNFYLWRWSLLEKQHYCYTCQNNQYFVNEDPSTGGSCKNASASYLDFIFDYVCETDCWDIFNSTNILLMNDAFTNGGLIQGKKVAEVQALTSFGALVHIKQFGLNEATNDFFELMRASGNTTGGLADPPPVTLTGNVSSISHPDVQVAGYFLVASMDKRLHWLDKKDVPSNIDLPGLFYFRSPIEEPEGFGGRIGPIPLAPCLESDLRTNIMPNGWQ